VKTRRPSHRYSVADHATGDDYDCYYCATPCDDDPCVVVTVRDGERHYRYSASSVPVTSAHLRAAAAAVSGYVRMRTRPC